MVVGVKLRNKLFWFFDLINKSRIRKFVDEIEYSFENYERNPRYISQKLDAILEDAIQNTEFYKNYKHKSITDFPVVDKNIIRDNLSLFLSKKFTEAEKIPVVTSGSTGTPFKTYQNKLKKTRNTADTIYFAKKGGYTLGTKLYYFKIWSDYNKKSILLRFLQNIQAVDVLNLSASIGAIFKKLQSNKSSVAFIGYVSAFETLSKYLDSQPPNIKKPKVCSIITMSESLDDYTKTTVEKHFNCPVLSRYSNIENGILAQQTLDDKHNFTINVASYYVEILDLEKNEVLDYGNLGRIVVTDYYNQAMPMIRYDTGDMGILNEKNIDGKKTLLLTHVEGRKLDRIYNTRGELISSYIVYKNMWRYPEIEQYQFVQISKQDYLFKICIKDKFQHEEKLMQEFKSYLGENANFDIEYVDEIPLLDSGKRKKVMSLYHHKL